MDKITFIVELKERLMQQFDLVFFDSNSRCISLQWPHPSAVSMAGAVCTHNYSGLNRLASHVYLDTFVNLKLLKSEKTL